MGHSELEQAPQSATVRTRKRFLVGFDVKTGGILGED